MSIGGWKQKFTGSVIGVSLTKAGCNADVAMHSDPGTSDDNEIHT
jgi:hypothetical protein